MDRLGPVIFTDDWGSTISIASLQGRPIPSAEPESELWMGAHESGPATVVRGAPSTLADVIAADPEKELGARCVQRFGARLPFLLKVLAPGRAISIQAHPSAEQARQRRGRDEREQGNPNVVYVDDRAKPEMLVAIAPFETFVGLRGHDEIVQIAARLDVPRLSALVARAETAEDPSHALLAGVLSIPGDERTRFVRRVVRACVREEAAPDQTGRACAAVVRVAEGHPDDIGLVVLLLMRHRVLAPGEYLDVPAGMLHSYVSGLGIEVLANSDNVVRAGLTTKPVDVEELLRIVDAGAGEGIGRPRAAGDGVEVYESHTQQFRLHRIARSEQASPIRVPGDDGPRIVFCLRGQAVLLGKDAHLELAATESAFLPAHEHDVDLRGAAEVYVVGCG